jgi:predicted AlkP superfamily pyrophosphatase or phosphodiesterase
LEQSPDDKLTAMFDYILREHQPGLALLHVAFVDHTEHLHGPKSPEAYAAVHAADNQIGEVWKELKKDFPNRATLIVVSDHGFSPIKKMILPNVTLRKAGLYKRKGGEVNLISQGGAAMLYIRDESKRDEVMAKIREAFKGVEGISKIAGPEELKQYGVADPAVDPHAPDMILFADEGCAFGDTAAGSLPFNDKPERKGSHGHDSNLPDLHATFVMWGVGVKPGVKTGEISNIDVAPTIAKFLNLQLPNPDGKPLAEMMSNQ